MITFCGWLTSHSPHLSDTITALDLSGCEGVSDQSAAHIASLIHLKDLNLQGCGLMDAGVISLVTTPLVDLRCLRLGGSTVNDTISSIGDNAIVVIECLPTLHTLDFQFCDISNETLVNIGAPSSFSDLRFLRVAYCRKVTKTGVDALHKQKLSLYIDSSFFPVSTLLLTPQVNELPLLLRIARTQLDRYVVRPILRRAQWIAERRSRVVSLCGCVVLTFFVLM